MGIVHVEVGRLAGPTTVLCSHSAVGPTNYWSRIRPVGALKQSTPAGILSTDIMTGHPLKGLSQLMYHLRWLTSGTGL